MTLEEAKSLAQRGIKMTHRYFTDMEYITMSNNIVVFEDGSSMMFDDWIRGKDYLLEGWSTFEKENINHFNQ